jgi:anti-anti-sigma regulatory factor
MSSGPTHHIDATECHDDRSEVIVCRGWLHGTACTELQRLIDQAMENGVERLRIDIREVTAFDESGLNCLSATARRCTELGIALEIEADEKHLPEEVPQ